MNRTVTELASRPYPFQAEKLETGEWYVRVVDLPGCVSYDKNLQAAIDGLQEAKEAWIETALEAGAAIPEPSSSATG